MKVLPFVFALGLTFVAHAAPSSAQDALPGQPARIDPSAEAPPQAAPVVPPQPGSAPPEPQVTVPLRVAQQYTAGLELMHVEAQLTRIRAERPRLFWPVALTAVGAGTTGLYALIAIASVIQSKRDGYRWDDDGDRHKYTYRDRDDMAYAREAGAGIGIGLAITALGVGLLVPRARKLARLHHEARPLQERRKQLRAQLGYALNVSPQQGTLVTTLRF